MSIDFDGAASKLEHTTADLDITTLITVCFWHFADGQGEGSQGRYIVLPEAGTSLSFGHRAAADQGRLVAAFSVTSGVWNWPATDNQWNAVAVSYDGGGITNDPIARVNFTAATVTETTPPVGTFTQPATGYCVGNLTAQSGTQDGSIAHMQVFNVLLTAGEMDSALRRPGSVRRGLKLWLPMYHAGYLVDLSGNAYNGTGTALTDRVGGPPAGNRAASNFSRSPGAALDSLVGSRQSLLGIGS